MTDPESAYEDAKRERYEEKIDRVLPEECECGVRVWRLLDVSPYGDPLEYGQRTVLSRLWECRGCGNEVEVTYD